METPAPGASGWLGSLRGLADGLLGSVYDRVELLSVELQEERYRFVQTLIWLGAILFFALMALLFVSFTLVVLFWATARLAVVAGLAATYTVALIAAIVGFKRHVARLPRPFAGTLAELRADRQCIPPTN
jgi:uncharacterized membrane protein YqjE